MAQVRLLHGKPLMVGGKVALSDDCCCQPAGCPTVIITFSGISFCVDVCLLRVLPDGSTKFLTYIGINDVPFSTSPFTMAGYACSYFNLTAGSTTELVYGESDCSSLGGLEAADGGAIVAKADNGSWIVQLSFAGEIMFLGTSAAHATSPVVITNEFVSCGQEGTLSLPIQDGRATFACGFGGTATIVF